MKLADCSVDPELKQLIRSVDDTIDRPVERGECLHYAKRFEDHLREQGHPSVSIQFGFFDGEKHAWNEVFGGGDVYIVDFTVEQFGNYPEVLVGPREDVLSEHPYEYD